MIAELKSNGIIHLIQLLEANASEVLKKIGMSPSQSTEAIKALNKVPIVDMKWSLVAVDEKN
jgi:hypothetical protein